MNGIKRTEHPNPQMKRNNWLTLNGPWDFLLDFGSSGIDRKFFEAAEWTHQILVPFCPESALSGIGYRDFMPMVWYRKQVCLGAQQLRGRVLLHFGAVDYESFVWVNGEKAGTHRGGYTAFTLDISKLVHEGENTIVLCARDDTRSGKQPRGKQSGLFQSHDCDYTRTTGIWQTVWLEFVADKYIQSVEYYPNLADSSLLIKAKTVGDGTLRAIASYQGVPCGEVTVHTAGQMAAAVLPLNQLHLWEAGEGRLYDLSLWFEEDEVQSYFGMREIRLDGDKFLLNGKSIFQRLVLDQGFYPDGIYTAPDEESLVRDIVISQKAGFNGARLHQKVFEPEFLYHCDRLGYLVWGEYGSWGIDHSAPDALKVYLPEWLEAVETGFNHPSIVVWCPFNETWDYEGKRQDDELLRLVWKFTKQSDPTRPCVDTSGNFHVATDIYDLHDYNQSPEQFRESYRPFAEGGVLKETFPERQQYTPGIPVLISEYGGIRWEHGNTQPDSWGYGIAPKSKSEFLERYKGLTDVLLDNPHMCGFCYTQLYDVEQEQNGLYTYRREPKFDMDVFKRINTRKAAIEE